MNSSQATHLLGYHSRSEHQKVRGKITQISEKLTTAAIYSQSHAADIRAASGSGTNKSFSDQIALSTRIPRSGRSENQAGRRRPRGRNSRHQEATTVGSFLRAIASNRATTPQDSPQQELAEASTNRCHTRTQKRRERASETHRQGGSTYDGL